MKVNCSVLSPVSLNCWKHHAGFIRQQIQTIKDLRAIEALKLLLLKTGDSQMDLYFGKYSPTEISEQILQILNRRKITSSEQYQVLLAKEEKNYQLVELKDKSLWTLRLGEESKRYVHLHPGRYSPHTVRVKATTLKTAILILAFKKAGETNVINTEAINQIRKKYLNEPAIKSYSSASGLVRVLDVLKETLPT